MRMPHNTSAFSIVTIYVQKQANNLAYRATVDRYFAIDVDSIKNASGVCAFWV